MLICLVCLKPFLPKRELQRNCGRACALTSTKKLWGKFVYPYTKRSKEEGLVGNMMQSWPKSNRNHGYVQINIKINELRENSTKI